MTQCETRVTNGSKYRNFLILSVLEENHFYNIISITVWFIVCILDNNADTYSTQICYLRLHVWTHMFVSTCVSHFNLISLIVASPNSSVALSWFFTNQLIFHIVTISDSDELLITIHSDKFSILHRKKEISINKKKTELLF